MSINPVQKPDPTSDAGATDGRVRPASTFHTAGSTRPVAPDPGNGPNREIHNQLSTSEASDLSKDEVQVQHDGGDGQIVIRYLDGSGNLILQIPSSQVLRLARAVDEALRQDQERQVSQTEGEIGGSHGH